jgi:hypothetical protein
MVDTTNYPASAATFVRSDVVDIAPRGDAEHGNVGRKARLVGLEP